ncbi:MAG: polymerase, partial [Bifidobacterium castoris]|nr:polymerase [Bifidobacterium castoris]
LSVVSIYVVFSIVSDKIRSSDSGMTHLFDFIQGIHIWGDAPLYGFGFESDDYIWQNYLSAFRSGLGYTSGMLFLAIHGGLLTLLCFFVPFVLWSTNPVSQKARLFPIFLLIIFLTVVVQNSGIFIFCLSLGYANYIWRNKRTEV